MTCQCTCGKHVLIDTSNYVTVFNNAAAAAAPNWLPSTLRGNTGGWPQFSAFIPTAAAAPDALPTINVSVP